MKYYINSQNDIIKVTTGFSWTTLFFGPFPLLFRGQILAFLLGLPMWIASIGWAGVLWAFGVNSAYERHLRSIGYDASPVGTPAMREPFETPVPNAPRPHRFQLEKFLAIWFIPSVILGLAVTVGAMYAVNDTPETRRASAISRSELTPTSLSEKIVQQNDEPNLGACVVYNASQAQKLGGLSQSESLLFAKDTCDTRKAEYTVCVASGTVKSQCLEKFNTTVE